MEQDIGFWSSEGFGLVGAKGKLWVRFFAFPETNNGHIALDDDPRERSFVNPVVVPIRAGQRRNVSDVAAVTRREDAHDARAHKDRFTMVIKQDSHRRVPQT